VARVGDLERRLAAALDVPPPPPPPPPPTVDVRARPLPLGLPPDERPRPRTSPAATVAELAELVDRMGDIERRLARIEAELGALR
jgi:hypothetical protein